MDTLVSLAGQFPLLGPVRDLHPLADIHASQTKKRELFTEFPFFVVCKEAALDNPIYNKVYPQSPI